MPATFRFGFTSERQLATIHEDLVRVLRRALGYGQIDFRVLCGHRNEADQTAAYATGKSQLRWPHGKHNRSPSHAVDIAVIARGKIRWQPRSPWDVLAGLVLAAAAEERVSVRWGGDWDGDGETDDQTFNDLGHFELGNPA